MTSKRKFQVYLMSDCATVPLFIEFSLAWPSLQLRKIFSSSKLRSSHLCYVLYPSQLLEMRIIVTLLLFQNMLMASMRENSLKSALQCVYGTENSWNVVFESEWKRSLSTAPRTS